MGAYPDADAVADGALGGDGGGGGSGVTELKFRAPLDGLGAPRLRLVLKGRAGGMLRNESLAPSTNVALTLPRAALSLAMCEPLFCVRNRTLDYADSATFVDDGACDDAAAQNVGAGPAALNGRVHAGTRFIQWARRSARPRCARVSASCRRSPRSGRLA